MNSLVDLMSNRIGYRGYIGSREYNGQLVPHHVQNLTIRNFCVRRGFKYLLSMTEYSMLGSYIMLEEVLRELPKSNGIILYSIFMLPRGDTERTRILNLVLENKCSLHGAVENLKNNDELSLQSVQDIINLNKIVLNNNYLTNVIKKTLRCPKVPICRLLASSHPYTNLQTVTTSNVWWMMIRLSVQK
jgi:sporadic carbohydrate cluster protein (TIGR04323 family)